MNNWIGRKSLLVSTASAFALAILPSEASAQAAVNAPDQVEVDDSQLGEIVVTARRRDEKLQDVPLAVSVMSAEGLKREMVQDQFDLQQKIPSLSVASRFGHSGGTYAMRGLSGTSVGTPTVGTYFAEVPTPSNNIGTDNSAGSALYDLESVQVLKGPQGTLFGRSTIGGAVLVTPAAPNLQDFKAEASASIGNLGYFQGTLALSVPIIKDVLAIRVAGNHNHRDGYTTVIGTGLKLDGMNNDAQRISVLFKPTSWFRNTTIYDRYHTDQTSASFIPVSINSGLAQFGWTAATPALNTVCNGAVAAGASPNLATCLSDRLAILASIKASLISEIARADAGGNALRYVNAGNSTNFIDRSTHHSIINRTEIDLPEFGPLELKLKNIFGYQKTEGFVGMNFAGIPRERTGVSCLGSLAGGIRFTNASTVGAAVAFGRIFSRL